ncbi:cytochrome P450 monooxygenase [Fusarium subglutinans]|uniref:Cytochrome P450 monooxygenase n=1 Tax=Gibberella subglutinans TaxID=42677 RepID=A0A8H5LCB2_GIBSU|nr:cytochrome P450 monooxygenase [Fusarium subglutinans]KAF5589033.1 cytochrome P450 monooxygenase [Fusarium subglutinans]
MRWEFLDKQQAALVLALGITSILIHHLFSKYYRLYHIPGPLIAKLTDLHRFFCVRSGFIHLYHAKAHERYGPVVRFGPNMVSVCDPDAIQMIFHKRNGFDKACGSDFTQNHFRPWTPDGLLLSVFTANNDEKNRRMKQHIAMYFSLSYVVSTFEKRIDRTINMFLNQLAQQFVATGASCDLTQWFKFFSYDAMGQMTFSRAYGCIEHGNDSIGIISDVKNTMLAIGPPEPVSCLLMYVLKRIAERKNNPTKFHNKVDAGPDLNSDFLGYFIQAQEKESNEVPPRFLSTWTLANILGGSDSTASMLRSVVCFLVENPDALQNVRDELQNKQRDVTGFSLPVPKWNELQNLPFLDACITESLRLDPPFATSLERIVPPGGMTVCGHFLPEGTVVGMNPYTTNRYRPTWGEDADMWRPSRWLEGDLAYKRKLEASLLSFGAGTRTCLGQNVAMFEIKKLVVALVMKYNFKLIKPREKNNKYSWIIMPETVEATIKSSAS